MAIQIICLKVCLILLMINGLHFMQWTNTPHDFSVKYTCTGSTAILPWTVDMFTGEDILYIRWSFEGKSNEVVAMLSGGSFLPSPSFTHRVSYMPNAGIALGPVTAADTGNYTVEFTGLNSNKAVDTIRRSIMLQVVDGLMTQNGSLNAWQLSDAVFSYSTQQWHVVLACGTLFTHGGQPPFDVEWITPSGQSVSSSQYKEGQFLLLLDNPVSGGSYTCRIPKASPATACLHGHASQSHVVTVVVDRVEARLAVLEAENKKLKEQVHKLSQGAEPTTQMMMMMNLETKLNHSVVHLENQLYGLIHAQAPGTAGAGLTVSPVHFHVRGLRDHSPASATTLIFPAVVSNHGNYYDPATGIFTAPADGVYCFMASLQASTPHNNISVLLMLEGRDIAYTRASGTGYTEAASLQAVVPVKSGQRVWLVPDGGSSFLQSTPLGASFSGFWIGPAP